MIDHSMQMKIFVYASRAIASIRQVHQLHIFECNLIGSFQHLGTLRRLLVPSRNSFLLQSNLVSVDRNLHRSRRLVLHNLNVNALVSQRRAEPQHYARGVDCDTAAIGPFGFTGNGAVETTANLIYIFAC